ncbi:MAG: 2-(1,2-epoxy-1,2-dihydrophenyl)acetyl-CoA isomerase [Gammaproteobacteria bacterium]|nr:2-(1,2-epoxy-1,2-dihydrophenyl)acetyl-CoA isomerase [Gammaproteobacteria bacterium]
MQVLSESIDGVAVIRLNRPEVMNAFGGTMRQDLLAALEHAARDNTIRCLVITGVGDAFCAGGDIVNMAELQANNDVGEIKQRIVLAARIVQMLRELPKPVIAAVNGAAAGAGINLALACDIRYASERAKFAESFVKIGLVPDWGGHYLLTQLVGTGRAMDLIMTGDRIDADEALRLGIVNRIYPHETMLEEVIERARALAAGPASALAAIKRGVYLGATGSLAETLEYEKAAQCIAFLSADAREGVRAFIEKRAPKFGREQ